MAVDATCSRVDPQVHLEVLGEVERFSTLAATFAIDVSDPEVPPQDVDNRLASRLRYMAERDRGTLRHR